VEAVDEGEVLELLVPEGAEEVPVNAVIARLKGEDEAAARAVAAPAPTSSAPAASAAPAPAPAAAPVTGVPPAGVPAPASGGRVKASPLARKVAALRGVALETLRGTGPGGRIVRADVEAAAGLVSSPGVLPAPAPAAEAAPAQPAAPAPAAVPAPLLPGAPPFETVKLSTMRKTIARRLTESKTTIPHFYLSIDCRLDALLALRTELNAALAGQGVKLSVNDFLVKALALALEQVPEANVSFAGDSLRRFARADISVAVAIPGGLITPVVRDAASRRLSHIATEMKDLAARARDGKLKPEEYSGGTASLSNLGMYGIDSFAAVINPPEGMILAVGAGARRPWAEGDALVAATVLSATGSFDHRAIDGAVGAQLMQAFRTAVEAPLAMLA